MTPYTNPGVSTGTATDARSESAVTLAGGLFTARVPDRSPVPYPIAGS